MKILSKGPRYEPTLIFALLQRSHSQSAQPTLKSSWHLPASRYLALFFMEQSRNYGGIPGIFRDFLWFSLLCISATQSLAFPSPRDRKVYDTSRRRHISCVRPIGTPFPLFSIQNPFFPTAHPVFNTYLQFYHCNIGLSIKKLDFCESLPMAYSGNFLRPFLRICLQTCINGNI